MQDGLVYVREPVYTRYIFEEKMTLFFGSMYR